MILLQAALLLTGCNVTTTVGKTKLDYANEFVANLSNDPAAYDYFYLEKAYTVSGGGWIVVQDDFGNMRAVDIYSYVRDAYAYDLDFFVNQSLAVYYVGGNTWSDYAGNLYEQDVTSKKDLEKMGAQLEAIKSEAVGQSLSAKFGLSEERGMQVAKLASNWKKVSKTRGLTEKDADAFSQKLLGFDLNAGVKAVEEFKTGKGEALENLLEKAAQVNGVSPEQLKEILADMLVK
jgi:hypothetical protein